MESRELRTGMVSLGSFCLSFATSSPTGIQNLIVLSSGTPLGSWEIL